MRLNNYINENIEWNKIMNSNLMLKSAKKVLDKIESKGYRAYMVGGVVRDLILNEPIHDVDIATNMPMEEIAKIWKIYDIGKSKDFGICVVREGGIQYEIAQFRQDGKYLNGRKPEKIEIVSDFKDDASRRDITINAMAIDKDGNIIDYFNGQKDIKNKIIRTVGNAHERFSEDYLRIPRTIRFASRLGFDIDPKTKKAAKELAPMVGKLSPERIKEEIFKAASQTGDKFAKYLIGLDEIGVLDIILPEITKLRGMEHPQKYHPEAPDVWGHVISALKQNKLTDPLVNLSIALHDIGKGVSLQYKPDGTPIYKGHDMAGLPLIDTIADRLKLSNKERDTLKYVVQNHMKVVKIKDMKPSKIAKLIDNPDWDTLLATAHADEFSRLHKSISKKEYDEIIKIAMDIKEKWGLSQGKKALKLVDGNEVMKLTGLKPSPILGKIIKKVEEWILDNNIKNQEEINNYIVAVSREIHV
jgi:tRNA nucleotidyltransferase/poly(A) polymerase